MYFVLLLVSAFVVVACESEPALPSEAQAGRALRPIGDVQLLPERGREPTRANPGAALVPDSKVRWTVKQALREAGFDVDVTVRSRMVTLRGTVPPGGREAAEAIVNRVDGVAKLRNELEEAP